MYTALGYQLFRRIYASSLPLLARKKWVGILPMTGAGDI